MTPELFVELDLFWVGFQIALCVWLVLLQVRFVMRWVAWMFSDAPRKAIKPVD